MAVREFFLMPFPGWSRPRFQNCPPCCTKQREQILHDVSQTWIQTGFRQGGHKQSCPLRELWLYPLSIFGVDIFSSIGEWSAYANGARIVNRDRFAYRAFAPDAIAVISAMAFVICVPRNWVKHSILNYLVPNLPKLVIMENSLLRVCSSRKTPGQRDIPYWWRSVHQV